MALHYADSSKIIVSVDRKKVTKTKKLYQQQALLNNI